MVALRPREPASSGRMSDSTGLSAFGGAAQRGPTCRSATSSTCSAHRLRLHPDWRVEGIGARLPNNHEPDLPSAAKQTGGPAWAGYGRRGRLRYDDTFGDSTTNLA